MSLICWFVSLCEVFQDSLTIEVCNTAEGLITFISIIC